MIFEKLCFCPLTLLFCAPPGFSSWASDRRGVVANLGVDDIFFGIILTLSYCTNLMLCQRVWIGFIPAHSALWYLDTIRFKFIHISTHHHTSWLRHLPGVGQHSSIRSPSGLSGSGCVSLVSGHKLGSNTFVTRVMWAFSVLEPKARVLPPRRFRKRVSFFLSLSNFVDLTTSQKTILGKLLCRIKVKNVSTKGRLWIRDKLLVLKPG